jgi:hypothetical protein
VKEATRRLTAATDAVRAEIRSVGVENGWEVEFAGGVEPGWHLMISRYVRRRFLEGALGTAIDEPRWRKLVRAEDFKQGGALHESLYVTTGLGTDDERRLLALEREDLALRRALSTGTSQVASGGPSGTVILNHHLRSVEISSGGGYCKLMPRQMDYLLLCALAKKKGAWFQTDDFKKLGGIGNPSAILSRLSELAKSLIEASKEGRRLRVDATIEEPERLGCGRVIDWDALQVREAPKSKR